jgi:hypothetical protein
MRPDPTPLRRAEHASTDPLPERIGPQGWHAQRRTAPARLPVLVFGALVAAGAICAIGGWNPIWPRPALEARADAHRELAATSHLSTEQQGVSSHPPSSRPEIKFPFLRWTEVHTTAVVQTTMLRLHENDRIFVLLFPDLAAQAAMLNRLAALIEKATLPRDRIASHAELAETIARSGETAERWYLGHDYSGTAIARFLAIAARDGVTLSPDEIWLRDRYQAARAVVPADGEIAIISAPNAGDGVDLDMRRAIIDHEIGHGYFFTRPEIATHVLDVWRQRFREDQRQAISAFLGREGYDTENEMLVANEAMAYLLFTPDPRFFSAATLGIREEALAAMRATMRLGFPWPEGVPIRPEFPG